MGAGICNPGAVDGAFTSLGQFWPGFSGELIDTVHVTMLSEAFIVVAGRIYLESQRSDDRIRPRKPVRHLIETEFAKPCLGLTHKTRLSKIQEMPSEII